MAELSLDWQLVQHASLVHADKLPDLHRELKECRIIDDWEVNPDTHWSGR
jgi:hypothetical protein